MASLRKMNTTQMNTFQELMENHHQQTMYHYGYGEIYYIYDKYDDPSVKDTERLTRSRTDAVEYNSISLSTELPKNVDTFWSSSNNKILLQDLSYDYAITKAKEIQTAQSNCIILDETKTRPTVLVENRSVRLLDWKKSPFEEADLRIPYHVWKALQDGCKIFLVLSNDTDIIVALLCQMPTFLNHCIEELWVKAGRGETTRYLPIHIMYNRLGRSLCSVLPAVHSLSGCDITSKVGTKPSALSADPVKYLTDFGHGVQLEPTVQTKAETYLVKVLKKTTGSETMNELRSEIYHQQKAKSHRDLPPTSQGIESHIRRSFFNTHCILNSINITEEPCLLLNSLDWGFALDGDYMLPNFKWRCLEDELTVVCACKKCTRSSCPCHAASVSCPPFCKCKSNECKNPFNTS